MPPSAAYPYFACLRFAIGSSDAVVRPSIEAAAKSAWGDDDEAAALPRKEPGAPDVVPKRASSSASVGPSVLFALANEAANSSPSTSERLLRSPVSEDAPEVGSIISLAVLSSVAKRWRSTRSLTLIIGTHRNISFSRFVAKASYADEPM